MIDARTSARVSLPLRKIAYVTRSELQPTSQRRLLHMRTPVVIALALVLVSALPALAQQQPLFDPQTGSINPNGAWSNQPAQRGTPPAPWVPYGGQTTPAPNQWSEPQPYQQ